MDFSDLFMFYNNDDNGDGGDVRGSGERKNDVKY